MTGPAPTGSHACKICGAEGRPACVKRGLQLDRTYTVHSCPRCGFSWVVDPELDADILYSDAYYRGQSPADPHVDYVFELEHPDETVRRYEWEGILSSVAHLRPDWRGCSWLDYGCGPGGLVGFLRSQGCREVEGTDVGPIAEMAKARGAPVRSKGELAGRRFDVVTCIEVLEHVADPVEALREIRSSMNPGGLLFLTTGNAAPFLGSLGSWYYIAPDVHISFFTPSALELALRAAGFTPRAYGRLPGLRDILKYRVLKVLRAKRRRAWQGALPWGWLARALDARFQMSRMPLGWVDPVGREP